MLTDAKIKAAKAGPKDYKLGDSGQLYLFVTTAGGKLWRMNYSFGPSKKDPKKLAQKTLTLGAYPHMTLVAARGARDAAKALIREGKDPAIEKRVAAADRAADAKNTFQVVGEQWFERNSGWSLEKLRAYKEDHAGKWSHRTARHWTVRRAPWSAIHSEDILKRLEADIYPEFGDLAISSIKASTVLAALKKVEDRGAIETAHRLRQRVASIFAFGIAQDLCESTPAASRGEVLTAKPLVKKQPSIIDGVEDQDKRLEAIRKLLADCEAERCRATTKFGLIFIALTAARPGEVQLASWDEFEHIDWDSEEPAPHALWRIPAGRMKGDEERKAEEFGDHMVPLAPQAVRLLRILNRLSGDLPYLFPSERHLHRPMSENTLRDLLIRAGYYQRHVPHGFRAAFSTYMNEKVDRDFHARGGQGVSPDRAIIDLMLAHRPDNKVEGAYNRAAYMPRRRELAGEWADLITAKLADPETYLGQKIRYAATGPGRPQPVNQE